MTKRSTRRRGRNRDSKALPLVPNTLKLLLALLIPFAIVMLRHGYIPARYSPFATVDLADPGGLFLDWRIAGLATDRSMCQRALKAPHIAVTPARPRIDTTLDGCGWSNGFTVSAAGGAKLSRPLTLSCEAAAATALWLEHAVQPAAERHFGARVTAVRHYGGYSCRLIRGGIGQYFPILSEHAKANAIDIAAFTLSNGRTINVLKDWPRETAAAGKFLRDVHTGACRFFRVTLGPEANALHRNHFHLDRGVLRSCR